MPSGFVEEAPVLEPVNPLEGWQFEVVESPSRATVPNELGPVEPDDRLG